MTLAAEDPVVMLGAPIPATQKLLDKTGMSLSDIGTYEINEAFASVPMSWARALEADTARFSHLVDAECRFVRTGYTEGVW